MLSLRTAGRAPAPISFALGRELEAADLVLLEGEKGSKPPPLKRIRDSHHAVARLLANGSKPAEVSAITGYSLSRVSILQADPAFKELVEFYRTVGPQQAFADLRERMVTLSLDAVEELRDRLEQDPDSISSSLLLDIAKVFADRTGHAPAKSTNITVNFDLARRLNAARERAGLAPALSPPSPPGPVIDGEVV